MSQSSANREDETHADSRSDRETLDSLLKWGQLLSSLVHVLDPFYQLDDLLQTDHPLAKSKEPLGTLVRCFGKGSGGADFLNWWKGSDDSLPVFRNEEALEESLPLGLAHKWRAAELSTAVKAGFEFFEREWSIGRDRLRHAETGTEAVFARPLSSGDWQQVCEGLGSENRIGVNKDAGVPLDDAIKRVRSFFAPLETPFFGMDDELLKSHVQDIIPREVPEQDMTPIVPLFGKDHLQRAFPSTAQLPAHLRVILHRLIRSQDNQDIVTSLLSTLEALDFSLRFATALGQGTVALLSETDFPGDFNPTTQQLIDDLMMVIEKVQSHWDHAASQAIVNLLFEGQELHPFLKWGGFDGNPRLLAWMLEAEEAIRQDNPATSAVLLSEMMEVFNAWISELTLLCSSWDLVTHARQDGYLQMSMSRGEIWISCKPLIDPTRYSVWLDKSELTLINSGGNWSGIKEEKESVQSLDSRITASDSDPPYLAEQLRALLRAHKQGQILPLGRALFFGFEYLVRLHASLSAGYLRHFYDDQSFMDPVLKEGGSLEHTIYFLSYSQRIIQQSELTEAAMLRQVFFDGSLAREFCQWLGLDGGVPGPLQGLLGWSLSLMRPDAKTRLDEVRGQVERLSGLFADFLDESRQLWSNCELKTDLKSEGLEACVLTFPTGLSIRGYPDLVVGPRNERRRRSVVVGAELSTEEFSDWDEGDFVAVDTTAEEAPSEPREEPTWPSFFEDSDEEKSESIWKPEDLESISRECQARSFSGPEARPRALAQQLASVVERQSADAASVLFVQGGPGTGKTFLCRTLTNPSCSPLPDDYPVLYLKMDRFPRTRLDTVVERLNDHLASEESLHRFEWNAVPVESLKALGSEVTRIEDDLLALGFSSEPLANRLASYLRQLKKLNHNRSFLLILDGFEEVPQSIVPSALPPGVHLLITGTEFPSLELATSPYMEYRHWDLEETDSDVFAGQLRGLQLSDSERDQSKAKFRSSLMAARAYRDLKELDETSPATATVLQDLFALARGKFSEQDKYSEFLRLLAILGLYERPIPLGTLQSLVEDGDLVKRSVEMFPSLFAFWDEPVPSLALAHSSILELVREASEVVESVSTELAETFLANPRRGELMPALCWFDSSPQTATLVETFFSEENTLSLWNDELAKLHQSRLFFHRVALLDAMSKPLGKAVQGGVGTLREELAWVQNARGLSLLELGLVKPALQDFGEAIELFSGQFASGDLNVLQAIASAHSRLSEAAVAQGDTELALANSLKSLEILQERQQTGPSDDGLVELRCRALLQYARAHINALSYDDALSQLTKAVSELEGLPSERADTLRGECFSLAAQALAAQGLEQEAIEQLDVAIELLLGGKTADLGLQALIHRGRLLGKVQKRDAASADLERALSILRYQVAQGRLDLETQLAYTAAQAALVGGGAKYSTNQELGEFIDWAKRRIRFEGRSDLRGLLAFLLLTRGAYWKDRNFFSKSASDLRGATEQYELLSREVPEDQDEGVWLALRQSFRNLTALYLSLDEPHLALICGRRALELGRRTPSGGGLEETSDLSLPEFSVSAEYLEDSSGLTEIRLYQLGKLYFHLGEAARRVGLTSDGATYLRRAARAFSQSSSHFKQPPESLKREYGLVLKMAAQSAFEDNDREALEQWVELLTELPDSLMTPFDRYRFYRWSGFVAQYRREYDFALSHYEKSLAVLGELREHPRWRSLEAESLLELGRVLSLQGEHEQALSRLEQASQKANDALFSEGEEVKELIVLSAVHSAVTSLRASRIQRALEQLRILVSLRPGPDIHEAESLALDWIEAWKNVEPPSGMELLKALGQLSELGDWLLRTSLGEWYRKLAVSLINSSEFESMIMSSSRIDRILETYLILTFSRVEHDVRPESNPELEKLLAAKFRAFDSENRDLEAELLMGHLLPLKMSEATGLLLLRRSEMALLRGDRGLAIIDLLRAIDGGGVCRLRAHLRLAEFLQSRSLENAATHHLRRALQSTDDRTEDLSELCGRFCRLLTRLSKSTIRLDLSFYREHFRVLASLDDDQLKPSLELKWLRPAREPSEWAELLQLTLKVLGRWQKAGHDKSSDWAFLEEVVDRTILSQGRMSLELLEGLGQFLAVSLSTFDVQNRMRASGLWERLATFLPGLGRREALALLQRLFDFTLRTDQASDEGQADEFLRRLEEEKRILLQPS